MSAYAEINQRFCFLLNPHEDVDTATAAMLTAVYKGLLEPDLVGVDSVESVFETLKIKKM